MSGGSEIVVDLMWNMALAELQHGGNSAIHNVINGIDRHYNDRCLTLIQSAHQQWRAGTPGQLSGSIGGVNVQSFYLAPFELFISNKRRRKRNIEIIHHQFAACFIGSCIGTMMSTCRPAMIGPIGAGLCLSGWALILGLIAILVITIMTEFIWT